MDDHTKKILENVMDKPPIAFHRIFKTITGNTNAALFLSQAWYWSKNKTVIKRLGWFYKAAREWEEETGLTRREQETARRICRDLGVIEEKLKKVYSPKKDEKVYGHATCHFRVNSNRVYELIDFSLADSAKLVDSTNPPNYIDSTNPPNYLNIDYQRLHNNSSPAAPKPEKIISFYKQEIGKITPTLQEKLMAAKQTYSEEWVLDALTESITYNKPSWAYAEAILKRWKQEGKTKTKGVHHANHKPSNTKGPGQQQPRQNQYSEADREAARRAMAKQRKPQPAGV